MPRVQLTLSNDDANLTFFGGDGFGGIFNFSSATYAAPGRSPGTV